LETIDFVRDNLKEQVDEIADCGLKGIKLHPQAQEFGIDSERAFKVYERAEELGLFISFHSGIHWHRLSESSVMLFDEVAYNFPELRFSMEHMGGYSFFNEALAVMVNNSRGGIQPRIFAGWTSIFDESEMSVWSLTDRQLEVLIFQTGEDNQIFGLDFPFKKADYILKGALIE
jgi:predicted TIM-barrel fold metal-dependent hydrolase